MMCDEINPLKDAVIGCIDVGSEQGWFVLDPRGGHSWGTTAEGYRDSLSCHLRNERLCLLGVEAPGFLPRERDYARLNRARVGETDFGQSRPWSVHAGKAATWRGLSLVPALLRDLRTCVPSERIGHLDFTRASSEQVRLLLFEAFVTGAPTGQVPLRVPECVRNECAHIWDAAIAVFTLQSQLVSGHIQSGIRDEAAMSLFGAALLATGWSTDVDLASHPVHVVRAFKPTLT